MKRLGVTGLHVGHSGPPLLTLCLILGSRNVAFKVCHKIKVANHSTGLTASCPLDRAQRQSSFIDPCGVPWVHVPFMAMGPGETYADAAAFVANLMVIIVIAKTVPKPTVDDRIVAPSFVSVTASSIPAVPAIVNATIGISKPISITIGPRPATIIGISIVTVVDTPTVAMSIHSATTDVASTIVIVSAHRIVAATTDTADIVIHLLPRPPPSASGGWPSCESWPVLPHFVAVARGVVWRSAGRGGGGDGGGIQDEEATAKTTPVTPPSAMPVTSDDSDSLQPLPPIPKLVLLGAGCIDAEDDSSLLPHAAPMMCSSSSARGRGGLSGFPHQVRRIAIHSRLPSTAMRSGSARHECGRPAAFAKVLLAVVPPRPGHPASLLSPST